MKKQIDIKPNKSLNQKQIILFLTITGILIFFIGVRFVIVGAWPILIFGIIEFILLVFCTYLYVNFSKILKITNYIFSNIENLIFQISYFLNFYKS